jgi:hypothetical protein
MKYLTMKAGDITIELSSHRTSDTIYIDADHEEELPLKLVGAMLEDEGFAVKVRPGPAHSITGTIPFWCLNAELSTQ